MKLIFRRLVVSARLGDICFLAATVVLPMIGEKANHSRFAFLGSTDFPTVIVALLFSGFGLVLLGAALTNIARHEQGRPTLVFGEMVYRLVGFMLIGLGFHLARASLESHTLVWHRCLIEAMVGFGICAFAGNCLLHLANTSAADRRLHEERRRAEERNATLAWTRPSAE